MRNRPFTEELVERSPEAITELQFLKKMKVSRHCVAYCKQCSFPTKINFLESLLLIAAVNDLASHGVFLVAHRPTQR